MLSESILEGLLKDRINFYLVFVPIFPGLSRLDFPEVRIYLLGAVIVVPAAISLAVWRTYQFYDLLCC